MKIKSRIETLSIFEDVFKKYKQSTHLFQPSLDEISIKIQLLELINQIEDHEQLTLAIYDLYRKEQNRQSVLLPKVRQALLEIYEIHEVSLRKDEVGQGWKVINENAKLESIMTAIRRKHFDQVSFKKQ